MKFRKDFVTNSSSSSFIVSININTKNNEDISFTGFGGTPESGRIDYFDAEALIRLSPKQMANAETVDEMIKLLCDGVVDGNEYDVSEDYTEKLEGVKIFEKSMPVEVLDFSEYDNEDFDFDEVETRTVDAYDFVKEIREKVKSMDDIKSIEISGEENNYVIYSQDYIYDKESDTYIGKVTGYPFEKDGSSGGIMILPDEDECEIEYFQINEE